MSTPKSTGGPPSNVEANTAGRVWRLADLKGKRTPINRWATWLWMAPPRAARGAEAPRGDQGPPGQDVVVLTVNLTTARGLIGPYMTGKRFTFPVLPALALVDKRDLERSRPRNWIAGPDGNRGRGKVVAWLFRPETDTGRSFGQR